MIMNRTAGKTKPMRKLRLGETKGRGSRTASGLSRVVKGSGAGIPAPANDTGLEPSPDLELDGALPEILEAEAAPAEASGEEQAHAGAAAAAGEDGAFPLHEENEAETEDDDEDSEEAEVAEVAEGAEGAAAPRRPSAGEDEPASFLAMYFRDMAELDVLRPEQEFETARTIEEMELDLWKTILGFAPGASWMADTVEKAVESPVPEMKGYRLVAERARKKSSIPARTRFEKEIVDLALKLRTIDIDRLFLDAAVAEIARVGRSTRGLPFEGQVPFPTGTKAFRDYVKVVGQKAFHLKQAKNEFVKANLRLVVSIARRFNHGRLPLADLIQEGNIGLMKAVERYDYRRGFRFSTYASWWIRHAISRALADKGRAVRLPVHMIDAYHRIAKSQREPVEAGASADDGGDRGGDGYRGRQAREDEDLPRGDARLARPPAFGRGWTPADRRAGRSQRGADGSRADGLVGDAGGDAAVAGASQADRSRHPPQAFRPGERSGANAEGDR